MADRAFLELAQTLCTRLCHDLSGPIGAVNSGAELLREEGDTPDPQVIALMTESAAAVTTRLRFLRAAMGTPGGRGLDPDAAHTLLDQYLAVAGGTRRPALDWSVPAHGEPPETVRPRVQALLNLCLVALEALPRADRLSVRAPSARAAQVLIGGTGQPRPGPLDAMRAGLDGPPPSGDPRDAQGAYTGVLIRALGLTVVMETDPGAVRLDLRPAGRDGSRMT
ncbi:histidine phosphotransferase family protein [Roseospira visakhapatnamensis]|uniref:Histidine phosphotransferase ChpT n=1 Tax=Roseospira visakhapatnamensis TaxID=390880 RepID=A0A7W6RFV6_9PROT|nr:histidine phosphotransferase family protein [Roseospira visakhapatnamensis]MBB4267522.1 histidine phosphotransferase ChpT [Roseospira visakhapatnamensis]